MKSKRPSQVRSFSQGKKAAIEMSVGTIVTIVLLMTTLILGLVLVRNIFSGAIQNIDSIDQAVKNEINELFAEDDARKIVVYPPSRQISVKKGETGGFGFSIRNTGDEDGVFSYGVNVLEVACSGISTAQAENLIILGKTGGNLNIISGSALDEPILVRFKIPDTVSLCNIGYGIDVKKDGAAYGNTISVYLEIKAA